MIEPTPEELATLKATHGASLRLSPPIRAGLEQVRIAVRAFDAASWDRYYDDSFAAADTATSNAFLRQLAWPSHAVCAKLTNASAALPTTVIKGLEDLAMGATNRAPAVRFEPLETTTSDAVLSAAGLARADADTLLAQAATQGVALELVMLRAGGALVLRAPEPLIFDQIMATRTKKGIAATARMAAIASTSWCSDGPTKEAVVALYQRLPGLATHLVSALLRLGGAGAENSFCFDD